MNLLSDSICRVDAFLEEVDRLLESEFPNDHSKEALVRLRRVFEAKRNRLEGFDEASDPSVVRQECGLVTRDLFIYLPLLGFLLRSTNIRNAFEVHGPLLRLASKLLEPGTPIENRHTYLVVSSEWDYSPFVYREIVDLAGFVLIGLPAPESTNPLLVPLAGHELGHALWSKRRLHDEFKPKLQLGVSNEAKKRLADLNEAFPGEQTLTEADVTSNMYCVRFLEPVVSWALRQVEETFCDFVGVKLFGESYLHAFAYLVSPSPQHPRSPVYPELTDRVANLLRATQEYGVPAPQEFDGRFDSQPMPPLNESDKFRVELADAVRDSVTDDALEVAEREVTHAGLKSPDVESTNRILARFAEVVPSEGVESVGTLLDAAWKAACQNDLWEDLAHISKHRNRVLRDLVLKNFEIMEIEFIVKEAT